MTLYYPNTRGNILASISGLVVLVFFLTALRKHTISSPSASPSRFQIRGSSHRNQYDQKVLGSSGNNDGDLENVQNATLGFQKIFVINLASRTDHRDAMSLAADVSGLQFEYVDGVRDFDHKALPPDAQNTPVKLGSIQSWRAHMNLIRTIVEQKITSALILEDDVDWDLRLKSQLQDFAKGSRHLLAQQPREPSSNKEKRQVTALKYPDPENETSLVRDFEIGKNTLLAPATTSPYGDVDDWDVLWPGHCGTHFAEQPAKNNIGIQDRKVQAGDRALIYNDTTVPEPQHVKIQFGDSQLVDTYPPHTRAIHDAKGTVCTLAYAISLPAARRLLYELAVEGDLGCEFDLLLGGYCDDSEGKAGKRGRCLTVQPQLFQHHRPRGSKTAWSNIQNANDGVGEAGWNEEAYTRNVRLSTRINLGRLIEKGGSGADDEFIDSFPDGVRVDYGY